MQRECEGVVLREHLLDKFAVRFRFHHATPFTRYFCVARQRIATGSTATMPSADTSPHRMPRSVLKKTTAVEIILTFDDVRNSAYVNSFHAAMKHMIAVAKSPVRTCGSTTRTMAPARLQPSSIAAS